MKLYVAFKVFRYNRANEFLGLFDDPQKIKDAYPISNTSESIIGYGPAVVNKAENVDVSEDWPDWVWLDY